MSSTNHLPDTGINVANPHWMSTKRKGRILEYTGTMEKYLLRLFSNLYCNLVREYGIIGIHDENMEDINSGIFNLR